MKFLISKILPWAPFLAFFVLFCVLKIIQIRLGTTSIYYTFDLFRVLGFCVFLIFTILLFIPGYGRYRRTRLFPLALFFFKMITIEFDDGMGFGDGLQIFSSFLTYWPFPSIFLVFPVLLLGSYLFIYCKIRGTIKEFLMYGVAPVLIFSFTWFLLVVRYPEINAYLFTLIFILIAMGFVRMTLSFLLEDKKSVSIILYRIFFVAIHLFFFKWIFAVHCYASNYFSREYLWCHDRTLLGFFDAFLFIGLIVLSYFLVLRHRKILHRVYQFSANLISKKSN